MPEPPAHGETPSPDMPKATPAMLREIYEQPQAIAATAERYLPGSPQAAQAFEGVAEVFRRSDRLVIAASGSSRHAGLAAEIMLEDLAGLPVDVEYASEYIYRSTHTLLHPAVLVLSQSGETADTLGALREAKGRGLATLAITNNAPSSMAKEAEVSLPTLAGKELAIPATKSFTTQLTVAYSLALYLARLRGRMTLQTAEAHARAMLELPAMLEAALPVWQQQVEELAPELLAASSLMYLGRGVHYAIAREGALKLKESAYLSAEGYPAGELKHGPNALVTRDAFLIMLATVDLEDPDSRVRYERVLQLSREMKARGARILALASEGDREMEASSDACLFVPRTRDLLAPVLEVVPLQLLAYTLAIRRGIDVDRPRNLVKAVVNE